MAKAAFREPAPRVALVRNRTVEKVDSIRFAVLTYTHWVSRAPRSLQRSSFSARLPSEPRG